MASTWAVPCLFRYTEGVFFQMLYANNYRNALEYLSKESELFRHLAFLWVGSRGCTIVIAVGNELVVTLFCKYSSL